MTLDFDANIDTNVVSNAETVSNTDTTTINTPIVEHKKVELPENPPEKTSAKRARSKAQKEESNEVVDQIEFKTAENTSEVSEEELKPIEINETVTIEETPVETVSKKEAAEKMVTECGVVIDNDETYFERLYAKQQQETVEESANEFKEKMIPEVINDYDELTTRRIVPKKVQNQVNIIPSESVKPADELPEGMSQYYVNALYIVDTTTNSKYLQGSILTLPTDVEKMSKIFKTSAKSGRIVRVADMQKKVIREKQAYDTRTRKWVKEGTPEYDAFQEYLQRKQDKIAAANQRKIAQERKRLGLD